MPRKYTRRHPPASTEPTAAQTTTINEAPSAGVVQLTALEQYGLWLKQNQHVTNPLPPEPPRPRKTK